MNALISDIRALMMVMCVLAGVLTSPSLMAETPHELAEKFDRITSDEQRRADVLQQGKERGQFCFRCHGDDGNSLRDYVPNLASQNPEYLFTQFEKFASGQRRHYVMSKLAKLLSPEERLAVAVYFADRQVRPRENRPAPDMKGQQIYQSLCFACHGDKGHGSQTYPRIAGQPYEFLQQTLMKFKQGDDSRKNSPMTAVVGNLSDSDLNAVASWVANMP